MHEAHRSRKGDGVYWYWRPVENPFFSSPTYCKLQLHKNLFKKTIACKWHSQGRFKKEITVICKDTMKERLTLTYRIVITLRFLIRKYYPLWCWPMFEIENTEQSLLGTARTAFSERENKIKTIYGNQSQLVTVTQTDDIHRCKQYFPVQQFNTSLQRRSRPNISHSATVFNTCIYVVKVTLSL